MSNDSQNQPTTQAGRVFAKFGGVPNLRRSWERFYEHKRISRPVRNISAMYRWDLPVSKGGTGGTIPRKALLEIFDIARLEGIVLTPDDTNPLPTVKR